MAWLLSCVPARSQTEPIPPPHAGVAMRSGVHPGYGRLVFDLPPGESGLMTQEGASLTLHFTAHGTPSVPAATPPNAEAIHAGEGEVVIGRSSYCSLVLDHDSLSRVHASLRIVGSATRQWPRSSRLARIRQSTISRWIIHRRRN